MRRTTALAQILGSRHGIDPFATTGRWPTRQPPRRDGEGHDGGDGGNTDHSDDGGGASDGTPDDSAGKPDDGDDEKLGEGGKKALERERAARKELEKKLAERDKADEKARLAKLDEKQRAEAERDAAAKEAEKARAELAVERAARKHGITDDKDLELLAGVPADKVEALAKRIAAASKGKDFGSEAGGGRSNSYETDPRKLADAAAQRRGTFY
ncbi:hypothetical protein IM25_21375 [Rhodococcus sp. p52]|uniref:hypothetical protein n=1 Tax=Rhodococcus sp. p52 TaxID=935199 RepID=UPI000824B4D3|nr:hypothetical protein [Rhodococcus sp. p52]AOD23816.1 hypothetical protein IM25_21375 [Rhodococcus sp. p52]